MGLRRRAAYVYRFRARYGHIDFQRLRLGGCIATPFQGLRRRPPGGYTSPVESLDGLRLGFSGGHGSNPWLSAFTGRVCGRPPGVSNRFNWTFQLFVLRIFLEIDGVPMKLAYSKLLILLVFFILTI